MPAFLALGPAGSPTIPGESTDSGHAKWIRINSVTAPITRSIPAGAKDQQRTKGDTTLGDIVIVRQLDSSSPKLAEACAVGTMYASAQIDFCTTILGKQQPYLTYTLQNVICSSYSFHGVSSGEPLPSEEITLAYTAISWTYVTLDPQTGTNKGNTVGGYNPATGAGQ